MNKYDKKEKAALALLTEYNKLDDLQKETRYYEPLEVPIFRGYTVSIKMREDVARSERGQRFEKVWHLITPKPQLIRASIWNKAKKSVFPMSAEQMIVNNYDSFGYSLRTYYSGELTEFAPKRQSKKDKKIHIYVGLHGISEKQWLELTPDLRKLFFKTSERFLHLRPYYKNREYLPNLQAFELAFKVEKYFQTEILVEDSRIDSRERELKDYLWYRDLRWLELPNVSVGKDHWGEKGANHHKYRYYGRKEKRARHHGYNRAAAKLAKTDLVAQAKEED